MIKKIYKIMIPVVIVIFTTVASARDLVKPELMLANIYHQGVDIDEYWVSEKYDGVRAIWDGKQLVSRGGNIYHAPKWFIQNFPNTKLDGELWVNRQSFELVVSTVRDKIPDDTAWRKVKFMVFDVPDNDGIFTQRLSYLQELIEAKNISWLVAVKQWKVSSHKELMSELEIITKAGAEGLMLHRGDSLYRGKRSGDLLKVKSYEDAEAIVIQHIPGKGKFTNMLGAMLVELPNGLRFKIGSGFSNQQRESPPVLGSTITYRFHGKTKNGVPRFASFLRVRNIDE